MSPGEANDVLSTSGSESCESERADDPAFRAKRLTRLLLLTGGNLRMTPALVSQGSDADYSAGARGCGTGASAAPEYVAPACARLARAIEMCFCLQGRIDDISARAEESEFEVLRAERENETLREEAIELREAIEGERALVACARDEAAGFRGDCAKLAKALDAQQPSYGDVVSQLERQKAALSGLKKVIAFRDVEIDHLRKQNSAMRRESEFNSPYDSAFRTPPPRRALQSLAGTPSRRNLNAISFGSSVSAATATPFGLPSDENLEPPAANKKCRKRRGTAEVPPDVKSSLYLQKVERELADYKVLVKSLTVQTRCMNQHFEDAF